MTRIAFAASLLVSCASLADSVRGSGNVQQESRMVGQFTGVAVQSGIRGEVRIGPQKVDLEADDNVLPLVETVIEDGTLVVRFKPHLSLFMNHAVVVHVTAPEIDALSASGGSNIRADLKPVDDLSIASSGGGDVEAHQVEARRLSASISGGGGLVLDGSADKVKLALSGGSRCRGQRFQARSLKLQASGGSTAKLAVTESVRGVASGGSVVHVRGSPEMHVVSSGGSVVDSD